MIAFAGLRFGAWAFVGGAVVGAAAMLRVMLWQQDARQLEALEAGLRIERQVVREVHRVDRQVVERIVEVQTKGVTIREEVPVYVTVTDDSACRVNRGFVRVFDAAVLLEDPGAAGERDREPSDVALSEIARVHAHNAQSWHELHAQWRGCVAAYDAVRRAVNDSLPE